MDSFPAGTGIGRRVALAIREAGSDVSSVAQAVDIATSDLEDRLSGRVDFEISELVRVGGFLRVPTPWFFGEAA